MGTKNNPGNFDCYANAAPDEPMFILLGRDRTAPSLVDIWAEHRRVNGEDPEKVEEAFACADSMREWLRSLDKEEVELTSVGSHIWRAFLQPVTGLGITVFINTVHKNIADAVRQAEELVQNKDRFDTPPTITLIQHEGVIAN